MYLNTHILFEDILQLLRPDLLFDIGSRDGKEALRFKSLSPSSIVVAYEANPYQTAKMECDEALLSAVTLRKAAVASYRGQATFFIARANYASEETIVNNLGQSSLLAGGVESQETIQVETTTLDQELLAHAPKHDFSCALWIDVEGAEADVFKGLQTCKNSVKLIHVECATRPRRSGQSTMRELSRILGQNHVNLGHTSTFWRGWGDAVFVHASLLASHGPAISRARSRARNAWVSYVSRRLLIRLSGRS